MEVLRTLHGYSVIISNYSAVSNITVSAFYSVAVHFYSSIHQNYIAITIVIHLLAAGGNELVVHGKYG